MIELEDRAPIHNDGSITETVFPMEFKADTLGKIEAPQPAKERVSDETICWS